MRKRKRYYYFVFFFNVTATTEIYTLSLHDALPISLESVGLFNNFLIVPMSFLGGTFFDPTMLPVALKPIVYALPLTYTTIGLRAIAYKPLSEFPWYCIPILLGFATLLTFVGAYQFSNQQD